MPTHLPNEGVERRSQPGGIRIGKLFHKKSRTGCQLCRTRRVKCDEVKPACTSCVRHNIQCVYDRVATETTSTPQSSQSGLSPNQGDGGDPLLSDRGDNTASTAPVDDASGGYLAGLGSRSPSEKITMELFYHYVVTTGLSIAADEASQNIFTTITSEMALKSDAVLYSVCAVAALHKAKLAGLSAEVAASDKETTEASSMVHLSAAFLNLALREHHKDVAALCVENVDNTCIASSVLRVYSMAGLQDRPLEPYIPPMRWLRMTGASNITFRRALTLSKVHPDSIGLRMMTIISNLMVELQDDQCIDGLAHLLRREEPHELLETWDADIYDAYKSAVKCIGAAWKAVDQLNSPGTLCRRLLVFPMLVQRLFLDLVEERRPRALVILAHYFALLSTVSRYWWIGNTGSRELLAIAGEVPLKWQGLMALPLSILKDPAIVATYYANR